MKLMKNVIPDDQLEQTYKELFKEDLQKNKMKINLENIDKVYDNGIKAIHNFSLEIQNGEFLVFLGPSGCGKTTALRMIAGLEAISDGYLKFNDTIMNSVTPKNRNIAMVFQNYALYPFMTVEKNISFGLKNKSMNNNAYRNNALEIAIAKNSNYSKIIENKAKIKILKSGDSLLIDNILRLKRDLKIEKIKKDLDGMEKTQSDLEIAKEELHSIKNSEETLSMIAELTEKNKELKETGTKNLEALKDARFKRREIMEAWNRNIPKIISDVTGMLGIQMYTKRKPAELSGGQRQRVALARAISKRTNLFMYDEPLSNLDAKLRGRMRSEIRDIHDRIGATSIYVTHDQIEAMSMADKIVVMNKGYIQQVGAPKELMDSPNNLFVAKFIGNTDINTFDAKYFKGQKFSIGKSSLSLASKPTLNSVTFKDHESVTLAFRPEHIIVEPALVANLKENKFKGVISRVELLGNETLVRIKTKELGEISAIYPSFHNIKINDKVSFVVNPNKISIFDKEYGYNLLKDFDKENENAKEVWINGLEERTKNQVILYRQKNRLKFMEYFRALVQWPFSKVAKEKIEAHKITPEINGEKVAK